MANETDPNRTTASTTTATAPGLPKVNWDASNMKSSYANVANVSFTREEVVMVFGMNQMWQPGQKEVTVQLTERLILSPYAAKRLLGLLGNAVREYEGRFGKLEGDAERK